MVVKIFQDKKSLSTAAAEQASTILRCSIRDRGRARIVVATGTSQLDFLDALATSPGIDWQSVEMFHLDEYIGLPITHPASFRKYLGSSTTSHLHVGAPDSASTRNHCRRPRRSQSPRGETVRRRRNHSDGAGIDPAHASGRYTLPRLRIRQPTEPRKASRVRRRQIATQMIKLKPTTAIPCRGGACPARRQPRHAPQSGAPTCR